MSLRLIILVIVVARVQATIAQTVVPHSVPTEFTTTYYKVTVNGQQVPIFHAGLNVYFASFDFTGQADVKVVANWQNSGFSGQTANKAFIKINNGNYWGLKPSVRPLSRNIHPVLQDNSLSFSLVQPGQYSIEREGTSSYTDDVLFLFANAPRGDSLQRMGSNIIYLPRGIHHKNIDLKSNETLFLDAGAVLFGSINVWDAEDVRICGRGTVVYYGPQSETTDDGWKHAKNWHPLTTHNVRKMLVEGVSFVGRSRTWSIQMYNTFDVVFDNVKVIAVNPQNINGDGFDWYGGGRTRIVNSLVRSMDDCFAFFTPGSSQDMWATDKSTAGEVKDITIEHCVLWTSLANIYRVGFAGQDLKTENIAMKDCDVLHISRGGWLAPNSIICAVSPNERGKGRHSTYSFENVRFEESCAIFGLQNREAQFKNIRFKAVSMPGEYVPSLIKSQVEDVMFDAVNLDGRSIRQLSDLVVKEHK